MLLLLTLSAALANTWGPWEDGFATEARVDAPTDGQLVYRANFRPAVRVVSGPGAPLELDSELLTGVGADPGALILPPAGGWVPGSDYVIEVDAYGAGTEAPALASVSFATSADVAPAVGEIVLQPVSLGVWSAEETYYAWGCCSHVRTVSIEVEAAGADPWARVELVGLFDLGRPGQVDKEPNQRLAYGLGPGTHTLETWQWVDEEDGVQPPCFEVVAVSAAGVAGAAQTVCADLPPALAPMPPGQEGDSGGAPADSAEAGCGCATGGAAPSSLFGLWMLGLGVLSRRS